MREVKIKRDELKQIVAKNRAEHRDIFLKAQEKYREEVIKELDAMLAEARAGRKVRRHIQLIEPTDYTAEYDRLLRMLELSTDDTVSLTEQEFTCYVMDEWGWSRAWAVSNSRYVSSQKLAQFTGEQD